MDLTLFLTEDCNLRCRYCYHKRSPQTMDENRIAARGGGTADLLREKIPLLLRYLPDAPVTVTIAPAWAGLLAESVRRFVEEDGFRHVLFNPAFGPDIDWTEPALEILAGQYQILADLYAKWHRQGRAVRLEPFEAKIGAYVRGETVCAQTCTMGLRRISVAADGRLYPCIQFVGDPAFCIGDVSAGIDGAARARVGQSLGPEPAACRTCAFRDRCRRACGCLNRLTGGSPGLPGGALCAHEQLLIRAADGLAERLFRDGDRQFLLRHYARPPQRTFPE